MVTEDRLRNQLFLIEDSEEVGRCSEKLEGSIVTEPISVVSRLSQEGFDNENL